MKLLIVGVALLCLTGCAILNPIDFAEQRYKQNKCREQGNIVHYLGASWICVSPCKENYFQRHGTFKGWERDCRE